MSQFKIIGTPAMRVFKRYVMLFLRVLCELCERQKNQYFIPLWIAATPNISFLTLISLKPA
jgi:hypothetical protein